ncbi:MULTISPECIES: HpcH/HpaI aldolase/citrate lyase family protein [unclassified Variovorax]|uniref:HpcH/HpaI aldolase/citrate lyase family protein n=1 Tax=unclassified Variovorax TaxID=663243 RepID=UPI003F455E60
MNPWLSFFIRTTCRRQFVLAERLSTTYLFVPGDRPERFDKAWASGADTVVLDLEDAIAADHKAVARSCVAETLGDSARRACVRINGIDTPWFQEDLRLLSLPGVACVMLPKAEGPEALAAAAAAAKGTVHLIPLIETARGLANASRLAECRSVLRLAFGSIDFQQDLGIEGDGDELLFARSQLVLASRLAQIGAPVDGVTLAVKDAAQASQDATRARRLGFGAKLCIHPSQVAPIRQAFEPDSQTIAWARGVLAAAAATSAGALTYEGRLIDKPVMDRARAVLARAGA